MQDILYYQKKENKNFIVNAFYIDVNIRQFLLVHEFIFIVLFVNLYKRNLYRRNFKNRKRKKKMNIKMKTELSNQIW